MSNVLVLRVVSMKTAARHSVQTVGLLEMKLTLVRGAEAVQVSELSCRRTRPGDASYKSTLQRRHKVSPQQTRTKTER